ncbi:MAG: hypothetical protein K2J18_00285, partial [Paramuribaculum sp.]|nr:hypothetical protein [Paramuribaculum sp.]
LPIYGRFMSKVYADKTLPYRQTSTFDIPGGIDLCEGAGMKSACDDENDSAGASIDCVSY